MKWLSVWKMRYAMHGVQFAIKSHLIVWHQCRRGSRPFVRHSGGIYAILNVFRCAQLTVYSSDSEDQSSTICTFMLMVLNPPTIACAATL